MPIVKSTDHNIAETLGKVKSKEITRLSAFVPGDDGQNAIPVVFSNFTGIGRVQKNGMHMTAEMQFCLGEQDPYPVPRKYGDAVDGVVYGMQVHLCAKKCPGESQKIHLGEWFYQSKAKLTDAEKAQLQPGEAVLLSCLESPATTWVPKTPSPQKKPKEPVAQFSIRTPPPQISAQIVEFCHENGVPEMAEVCARQGLRSRAELARMEKEDCDALFLTEQLDVGTRSRFRQAIDREKGAAEDRKVAEQGSGWVEVGSGVELGVSQVRGEGLGGPPCLLDEERGSGFVELPRRDGC